MSEHTYNEETASEIVSRICEDYFQLFKDFQTKVEQFSSRNMWGVLSNASLFNQVQAGSGLSSQGQAKSRTRQNR